MEAVGGADGCTPLLAAAKAGRSAAVAALTAAGAKLGIKDAKGWTPLMHLVAAGKVADAQTLLQAASSGGGNGACINAAATEPAGTTALSLAIDQAYSGAAAGSTSDADRLSFVSLLLDHGADPDAPAASGTSSSSSSSSSPQADSLVLAAMRQQRWPLAKLLLAKSAKASAKGASGDTVMSLAVAAEQGELIELAIAQGADVSGPEGRKLLEAALAGGRDAVAAALAGAVPSSVLTELKLEYKGLLAKGVVFPPPPDHMLPGVLPLSSPAFWVLPDGG